MGHIRRGIGTANSVLAALLHPDRNLVLFGDSMIGMFETWRWFPLKRYINKGVGGNGTSHMLFRFRPDVLDLHPRGVFIWGGTNDFDDGVTAQVAADNIARMCELAKGSGIVPIVATVGPRRESVPAANRYILELNALIRQHGARYTIADLHPVLVDECGELNANFAIDQVHLNRLGYKVILPIVQQSIGLI